MKRLIASIALAVATAIGVTCAGPHAHTAAPPNANAPQGAAAPPAVTIGSGDLSQPELPAQAGPDAMAEVAVDASAVVFKYPAPQPAPRYAAPAGHWERRGLFGRQSVWVTTSPQPPKQQNYRGGSCASGRCP